MAKHAAVAYALWFMGSWLGLHHLYLNRPRAAFLTAVTLNGCGIAWFRDLLVIPQLVAQANASDEYKEKLGVDRKFNSKPPLSLLVTCMQFIVARLFSSIAASLLPKGTPEITSELLFVIGAAYGITFAGEALDPETQAPMRWVFVAVLSVVFPAYSYYGFDGSDDDYQYCQTAAIVGGCVVYIVTRHWSIESDQNLQDTTATASPSSSSQMNKKLKPQPSFIKTLLKYWAMLGVFFTCATTALLFHGDVRIEVNGEEVVTPFFEACTNFFQSEAFQTFSATFQDLYNGKSYDERFEQRWKRFNTEMDLSGKFRNLKVLGLPRNASEKEIKAAYRRLVLQWHPDKYTGEDKIHANEMFYKIQEAYEKLVATANDEKKTKQSKTKSTRKTETKRGFGSSDEL